MLHPLACLVDDGRGFRSYTMRDYHGSSEHEKIEHILSKAERICPYTSLLYEASEPKPVSSESVLCAYTRPLAHDEARSILRLKVVIKYQHHRSAPLWFTVSLQRNLSSEPRHETDQTRAVFTATPTPLPADDAPTSAQTCSLEWTHGEPNFKSLDSNIRDGHLICIWAHTE